MEHTSDLTSLHSKQTVPIYKATAFYVAAYEAYWLYANTLSKDKSQLQSKV